MGINLSQTVILFANAAQPGELSFLAAPDFKYLPKETRQMLSKMSYSVDSGVSNPFPNKSPVLSFNCIAVQS